MRVMPTRRSPARADDTISNQQRERLFQTGVFISMMMVMLDAGSNHPIMVPPEIPSKAEVAGLNHMKEVMEAQSGDGREYPVNVSGRYHGNWTRQPRKLSNTSSTSSLNTKLQFKLTSSNGPFAIQVFQEPVVNLPDISIVRGYFQMLGDAEPLRHQLTSAVQGVYFHKYGRVSLVTSQDRMFLKSSRPFNSNSTEESPVVSSSERKNESPSKEMRIGKGKVLSPYTAKNSNRVDRETLSMEHSTKQQSSKQSSHDVGGGSGGQGLDSIYQNDSKGSQAGRKRRKLSVSHVKSIQHSLEQELDHFKHLHSPPQGFKDLQDMISIMDNASTRRRLAEAFENETDSTDSKLIAATEPTAPSTLASKIGLSIGAASTDKNYYVYHLPTSPTKSASSPLGGSINHDIPKCLYLLNLKVGPSCEKEKCGKNMPPHAALTLEGRIHSDNCKVDMSLYSEAFRIDWDQAQPKAAKYSLYATIACFTQIMCLFLQLHHTELPSAAAQVSIATIGMQSILDAIVCIIHMLTCAFLPQLFTPFASVAFLKLVIFIIIEMRYIVVITHSRDPQRFQQGGINQLRQEWALIHLRFYFGLFVTLVTLYILRHYMDFLVMIAFSFWIPQIVLNMIKGHRKPLHHLYVYGMSVSRLMIPLYIYGCPSNVALTITGQNFKPKYYMCVLLVLWVSLQCWILKLQQLYGGQFLVPARFLPPVYNYSRPIPASLLENLNNATTPPTLLPSLNSMEEGQARGDLQHHSSPSSSASMAAAAIVANECAICYQTIDVEGAQNSGNYMLTPCDHLFHTNCLERWMEQKLECPICRHSLPPRFPS